MKLKGHLFCQCLAAFRKSAELLDASLVINIFQETCFCFSWILAVVTFCSVTYIFCYWCSLFTLASYVYIAFSFLYSDFESTAPIFLFPLSYLCLHRLNVFGFWILNKIFLSSVLTRTMSQISWQVRLFASPFCNISFAVFPWSSVASSINGSWALQGQSCRRGNRLCSRV